MPETNGNETLTPDDGNQKPIHNAEEAISGSPLEEASAAASRVLETETKKPEKKRIVISKKLSAIVLIVLAAVVGILAWLVVFKKTADAPAVMTSIEEVKRFGVAPVLIEGAVEISKDEGATWKSLSTESPIKERDMIRTLSDGRAVLLIDDGSATRLAANSSIQLTSLKTSSIIITNVSGETYNRVLPSTSRTYSVVAEEQAFTAKGTAFRTFNKEDKKGVEVYHSAVAVEKKETDVTEGNAFYTLNPQKEKENTVSALDLSALKNDEFLKWNSEQDKKTAEFANALGVLAELDKPVPAPTPPAPAPSGGITLSASVTEYSANFSWKVNGINTSKGFKLVKSKTSQSPTYPENSAAFIESGKSSYSLYLGDGKTYYFRICAYRGDSCESYSNTVTVTTPLKPKEDVVSGAVTLSLSGKMATWTFAGTAPYGFKLVGSKTSSPTYGSSEFTKYSDGTTTEVPTGLESGSTYYIRVCKYKDSACVDYSNEVTYIAP